MESYHGCRRSEFAFPNGPRGKGGEVRGIQEQKRDGRECEPKVTRLINRALSSYFNQQEDIQARLSAMQKLGAGRPNAKEEEILKSELSLAHRRNDMVAVKALQAQLIDMQNVRKAQEDGDVSVDVMADMLAKVNERSRRTVQESHKRAFKVETERKRLALGDFKGKM
jgi:hypothetical protein